MVIPSGWGRTLWSSAPAPLRPSGVGKPAPEYEARTARISGVALLQPVYGLGRVSHVSAGSDGRHGIERSIYISFRAMVAGTAGT